MGNVIMWCFLVYFLGELGFMGFFFKECSYLCDWEIDRCMWFIGVGR